MAVFWNCLILLLTTLKIATTAQVAEYNVDWLEMMQTLQNEVKNIKNENKELKSKISDLQDGVANMKIPKTVKVDPLFLATISEITIPITDEETIIFDKALINPGGYYNTERGTYKAPYNGYYQFSVQKMGNDYCPSFWVLVDERHYLTTGPEILSEFTPSTAITINIQLKAGQTVRMENQISSLIYGTATTGVIDSWFTGFMLYEL